MSSFGCVICYENKRENNPRYSGADRICNQCAEESVAPLFHAALKHEHHYPPKCGKDELDIWMFWGIFDDDFKQAWHKKIEEYAVPIRDRVYCEYRYGGSGEICGGFLGERGQGKFLCERCEQHICGRCGGGIGSGGGGSGSNLRDNSSANRDSDDGSRSGHKCREASAATIDPFAEMTRGRHYQLCPGCNNGILLAAGCNHMVCTPPCNTHFCFVCGKQVAAQLSGHWHEGGCPRYGAPGGNCNYDEHDFHSDDEGDYDDEAMDISSGEEPE